MSRWRALALTFAGPAVALALTATVAQAHGGGAGFGGGPGEMHELMAFRMNRVLDSVKATDAQKAQIKAAWQNLRPQFQALRQERQQVREQTAQALAAPTVDTARVEQLRKQSVQLMDRGSHLFTQGMVATAQALSPEQRKQVLDRFEQRRHEWQKEGR